MKNYRFNVLDISLGLIIIPMISLLNGILTIVPKEQYAEKPSAFPAFSLYPLIYVGIGLGIYGLIKLRKEKTIKWYVILGLITFVVLMYAYMIYNLMTNPNIM